MWRTRLRLIAITLVFKFDVFKRIEVFYFYAVDKRDDEPTGGCFFEIRSKKH
jgi:hypothetical protein